MSQNSVSVIGPRATPQKQEKEKPDTMDQILRGLQLAQGITGIAVNFSTIQNHMAQTAAAEDKANNYVTRQDILDKQPQGLRPAQPGEAGAVEYKLHGPDGNDIKESYVVGSKKGPVYGWVTKLDAKGSPLREYVELQNGTQSAVVPKAQETMAVETTDDKGNAVTKIVPKVAGASYPKPNKADDPNKAPTADQSKAALFGKRMEQAEGVFGDLVKSGYDRADKGSAAETLKPEMFQGENLKKQQQAEDNFLNALLRRESGAAISKEERSSGERQYFPRAGDTPEVLEQKRQNRELATQGMLAEGGNAVGKIKLPEARAVTGSHESGSAMAATPPKAGEVQKGYRFKGGDPADKNNWEKVN